MPLDFERLVDLAERVVRGTVVATRCEWRTHEDGRFIVTIVTVHVEDTIVGAAEPVLELQFLGGKLDGQSMEISGQPHLQVGDEDILFVTGNGRSVCPLVGMTYGRVLVITNPDGRTTVARNNGAPIKALAELRTPLSEAQPARAMGAMGREQAMSVDDFCAAIRNHALRQGRRDIAVK
jgi:hypothetical protein